MCKSGSTRRSVIVEERGGPDMDMAKFPALVSTHVEQCAFLEELDDETVADAFEEFIEKNNLVGQEAELWDAFAYHFRYFFNVRKRD